MVRCNLWYLREEQSEKGVSHNTDRPWGQYIKWNKLERQIPYDFTYNLEFLKKQRNKQKPSSWREQTDGCDRWRMGLVRNGLRGSKVLTSSYKIICQGM